MSPIRRRDVTHPSASKDAKGRTFEIYKKLTHGNRVTSKIEVTCAVTKKPNEIREHIQTPVVIFRPPSNPPPT